MSAFCLKLFALLCLHCTGAETVGVIRRTAGEDITIQCRCTENPKYLSLRTGLNKETAVFFKVLESGDHNVAKDFVGRLQFNGGVSTMDILIKNLTLKDTGPYWCMYTKLTPTYKSEDVEGTGSLLLVVTEPPTRTQDECNMQKTESGPVQQDVLLLGVVVAAAVLLGIIMAVLIWVLKTKQSRPTVKPRHATTNDVYEDMRGTLRR